MRHDEGALSVRTLDRVILYLTFWLVVALHWRHH
jgi:hypothetical protein